MEEVLKRKVSKKEFLKITGGILAGIFLLSGLGFLKKKEDNKVSYGRGAYGG